VLGGANILIFCAQGMVLCTSNADHTQVKLLEPPANSKPGDRVTFVGFSGEPAPAAQVAKKKLLEKLAPDVSY
jgi:tRNA-binding EMAP/Myf-like protein